MTAAETRTALGRLRGDTLNAEAARFLLAGVLNTLFGYLVFALATAAGANTFLALTVSTAAGVAFNFQTSRRLVFGRGAPGREVRFVALYAGLLVANWAALRAAQALGAPRLLAQAALLLPFAALSFAGQRLFVFRTAAEPVPPVGVRRLEFGPLFRTAPMDGQVAVPTRLIAGVFALGAAVFLCTLVRVEIALPACALLGMGVWTIFRPAPHATEPGGRAAWGLWALCLGVALALCLLGGEGRLFYANTDWQIRDAVMVDLATHAWPVVYHPPGAVPSVLRAPLGMFMLPALVGRAFGWRAAQPALLVQDTVVLAAALALLLGGLRRGSRRAVMLAVVFAFSGFDILGEFLVGHFVQPRGWHLTVPHLETWSFGLQYSSLVTDLFWAPNHALPALALAGGYLAWRRGQLPATALAALGGLAMLWSPLALLGALPFIAIAGLSELKDGRMGWLAPARLAPLAIGLLPAFAFLTLGGGTVEHGLNLGRPAFQWYGLFVLVEVVPLLYLAQRGAARGGAGWRTDLAVCATMLVLMPFYYIGGSNDFLMRASIVPIVLLAVMAGNGFLAGERSRASGGALAFAVLALGAATPACEVVRALVQPVDPPRPTGLIEAWQDPASRGTSMTTYLVPRATYDRSRALKPGA